MTNKSSYKPINHQYDVVAPARAVGYLIDKLDWEFLKAKIGKLKFSSPVFANLAALFAGGFLSGLLSIFTNEFCSPSTDYCSKYIFTLTYTIGCIIISILCLIFSKLLKEQDVSSVTEIKDFIANIEEKLENISDS